AREPAHPYRHRNYGYAGRSPEQAVLYRVMQHDLADFLRSAATNYQAYVHRKQQAESSGATLKGLRYWPLALALQAPRRRRHRFGGTTSTMTPLAMTRLATRNR